jgi:hypothetical protein
MRDTAAACRGYEVSVTCEEEGYLRQLLRSAALKIEAAPIQHDTGAEPTGVGP